MINFGDDGIWDHEVRLFPTVRISSDREAELRATAALCSMVTAVSEFGRVLVKAAGGPAGRITCYTEISIPNQEPDGPELRPDAVVRVVRGKREWVGMVEVKVGDNPLDQSQIDDYHRLAKDNGFDAVITISNQAARPDGLPPLNVDRRRLRSVPMFHLSWDRLLSEARVLTRNEGIADTDQQWMMNEWIRYVADPTSRIISPPTLGEHWNEILRAAREGNLATAARFIPETVGQWEAFLRKLSLRLRAQLGVDVERRLSRIDRKDAGGFIKRVNEEVLRTGILNGTFRVPDAAGDISLELVLQARAVRYRVEIKPPSEGRAQTRVNWLVRQLKGDGLPSDLVVHVHWDKARITSAGRLTDVREDIGCLLRDPHQRPVPKTAQPRRFSIEWTTGLSKGRGKSTAPILDSIASDLERFYRQVVEVLVPYIPKAPRLPEMHEEQESPSQIPTEIPSKVTVPLTAEDEISHESVASEHVNEAPQVDDQ